MKFQNNQLALLREFITLMKAYPGEIHNPELKFVKDWIESFGIQLPPAAEVPPAPTNAEENDPEPAPEETQQEEETPKAEMKPDDSSEDSPESELELDNEGVIEPDTDEHQPMGDPSVEVTEEANEEAGEKRSGGLSAMSEGKMDEAIALFTEAVIKNPCSAPTFAKRARCYINLKKPNAAIRDCNRAIELNPDSAAAYKWRGKAYRLLGLYEEAKRDLATACRIDYDDDANELLKSVSINANKIEAHKRKQERKKQEREIKARRKRVEAARKEQEKREKEEQRRKAAAGDFPTGFPGGAFPGAAGFPGAGAAGFPGAGAANQGQGSGGMPPNIAEVLQDPEVMANLQDPEVVAALQDVMSNPANISKYENNPKVAAVFSKLSSKMEQ